MAVPDPMTRQQAELGLELGVHLVSVGSGGSRERAVFCRECGVTSTWNVCGYCDGCGVHQIEPGRTCRPRPSGTILRGRGGEETGAGR